MEDRFLKKTILDYAQLNLILTLTFFQYDLGKNRMRLMNSIFLSYYFEEKL